MLLKQEKPSPEVFEENQLDSNQDEDVDQTASVSNPMCGRGLDKGLEC